jgi:hypothetical protein
MEAFKKGDPVECDDYGIGYVVRIAKHKYPICVEFQSDNSVVYYTLDGRSVKNTPITLHHSNHGWRG